MKKCLSIDCRYTMIIDFSAEQEPLLRGDTEFILVEFALWKYILVFDIK